MIRREQLRKHCGELAWREVQALYPTGSAYISQDVVPNDYDYVLLVEDLEHMVVLLMEAGWRAAGELYPNMSGGWCSLRYNEFNVMVTADSVWYTRYAAATELARAHNLMYRADRVSAFAAVRDGTMEPGQHGVPWIPSMPREADE